MTNKYTICQIEFRHCNLKPNENLQKFLGDVACMTRWCFLRDTDDILKWLANDHFVDTTRCVEKK